MRPIYGCPEKFRESSQTPPAIFPEICKGLLFRSILRMCIQNLKFVASSVPEIIRGTQRNFLVSSVRRFYFGDGRVGRSRSSKVNKFGANRKRGVNFLLVRNSNFGPMLHRFRARRRFMCYLPHPYSTLILGVFPLHQIAHVGRQPEQSP